MPRTISSVSFPPSHHPLPFLSPPPLPRPTFFYSPRHFGPEFQLPAEIDFSRILLPGASAFNRFTLFSWKGESRRASPTPEEASNFRLSSLKRSPSRVGILSYDYRTIRRTQEDGSSESEVCPGLDYRPPIFFDRTCRHRLANGDKNLPWIPGYDQSFVRSFLAAGFRDSMISFLRIAGHFRKETRGIKLEYLAAEAWLLGSLF